MGDKLSYSFEERNKEAMIKLDGKITDLYYWGDSTGIKADDYLIENSKPPLLEYDHVVNKDTIRAAIIGGDVISDINSSYRGFYFFTDYVENELYAFNVDTTELYIFPLPPVGNPTSLKVNPFKKDSILIAYSNGKVMDIDLP